MVGKRLWGEMVKFDRVIDGDYEAICGLEAVRDLEKTSKLVAGNGTK
jgi:hypothetical protein